MNGIIKVLIADDNERLAGILATYIQEQEDMEVVGIAKDGKEAIEMIEEKKPDVALIDIIMPYIDGISVLEKSEKNKKKDRPMCIMLSAIGSDIVIQKAMELGAEYFYQKPFDLEIVVNRIRKFIDSKPKSRIAPDFIEVKNKDEKLEVLVTEFIHQIGIPAHLKGYSYIREAIIMRVNDTNVTDTISKTLYPKIAYQFETTPSRVERAIRHAIEIVWNRKNQKETNIEEMFANTFTKSKRKPSNNEFIVTVAERIRLQYKIK